MSPEVGDMLIVAFDRVNVWSDAGDDPLDTLGRGDLVVVVGVKNSKYPKRINPTHYRKIVSPRGVLGWIHLDNCKQIT